PQGRSPAAFPRGSMVTIKNAEAFSERRRTGPGRWRERPLAGKAVSAVGGYGSAVFVGSCRLADFAQYIRHRFDAGVGAAHVAPEHQTGVAFQTIGRGIGLNQGDQLAGVDIVVAGKVQAADVD